MLFLAEGCGAGRCPVAPGTVGTLVGFVWIYLLLMPQNVLVYCGGTVAGLFAAVWIGARGEKISGIKDPASIVIDEIAALPVAFVGSVLANVKEGVTPPLSFYFSGGEMLALVVAFVGFRIFDVWKPWIIHRSQELPNGWGLVVDDFLAALPVAVLTYLATRFF
jgi:phosphatidylglycerophosphatase A